MKYHAIPRWAALALALSIAACGGSVELVGSLNEAEANEVIAALAEGGIQADKMPGKDGVMGVAVAQASVAPALNLLRDAGLPRERRATMGDVFRKEGLISSPLEERARYLWALSQELSETISQVDGVLKARVHVVLPERGVGGEPPVPSSAAVFVKHRRNQAVEAVVPEIRRLVANSIPGLTVEKVTVVLVPAGARPGGEALAQAGAAASPGTQVTARDIAKGGDMTRMLLAGGGVATLSLAAGAGWIATRRRPEGEDAGAPPSKNP